MEQPFLLHAFPRAIIHIDADSFFASCEQSLNPLLRGKPLITGRERGIASAVSIEAKRLGIKRGMSIREIKEICPTIIYLPSDYETYSLISKRMFEIVRRYTNVLEEYSIDECFADISGLRRPLYMSYRTIAEHIKHDLEQELGMTFSLGLAPTKVLAKLGSKWNKPSGLVIIPGTELHLFLRKVPIQDVWGIGEQTTKHMQGLGINTAFDLARMEWNLVNGHFTKPHQEIWHELRGNARLLLETEENMANSRSAKQNIHPDHDRHKLYSRTTFKEHRKCMHQSTTTQTRRAPNTFTLRTQDYQHYGHEIKLSRPTNLLVK